MKINKTGANPNHSNLPSRITGSWLLMALLTGSALLLPSTANLQTITQSSSVSDVKSDVTPQSNEPGQSFSYDSARPEAPYGAQSTYRIFRKNREIGRHTLSFQKNGEEINVAIESNIKVTVLKVPVFRFNYQAKETWKNGELVRVESTVTTNGKRINNSLENTATVATLTNKDGTTRMDSLAYASNHWHPAVTTSSVVFNTLTGKVSRIAITPVVREMIELPSGAVEATRFVYSGDIAATSWYDSDGRWVKLQFSGEDGSTIEYRYDASAR